MSSMVQLSRTLQFSRLSVAVIATFFFGCTTLQKPTELEWLRLEAMREISCLPDENFTYRMTIMNEDGLLGSFDVELTGDDTPSRQVVVFTDTMQEMLALRFDARMKLLTSVDFTVSDQNIRMQNDAVEFDGYRVPIGPGEMACLMAARLPVWWLDHHVNGWDAADKRFVLDQRFRRISYKRTESGNLDVRVSWRSSWFTGHEIRVLSSSGAGETGRSGELRGPRGLKVKWIEV